MRSERPIPGNPWPHDMVLRIDEPQPLTALLFVREAWRLPIDEVPALDAIPDVGTSARPADLDLDDAVARWRLEWERAFAGVVPGDREVRAPDADIARLLREARDEDLSDALAMRSLFRSAAIDHAAFGAWKSSLRDPHGVPLAEHPERISVEALVAAWRAGLENIVQLPFAGYFAERIHASTLVVSRTARHDPELYRRALATPGSGSAG
jgi:hypothetical protein